MVSLFDGALLVLLIPDMSVFLGVNSGQWAGLEQDVSIGITVL